MPAPTDDSPDFKTIRKSVSYLGKNRRVDQRKVPHLMRSLDARQKVTEESVRVPLTFRKRIVLETDQTIVNGATQRLERGCAEDLVESEVLNTRGSLPSIISKYSRYQSKQRDAAAHQSVTLTLKSKDLTKTKDNDATPLSLPGTIHSEQNNVDASAVTDKTLLRQENGLHREVANRGRKNLKDLFGGRIYAHPTTERKRRLREDEDTATARVNYHPHSLHHHHHHHHQHQLNAAAENNGHHHRHRHHPSESRPLHLRNDQLDIGHLKEPEKDPYSQTINDILKQIANDPSKQKKTNDSLMRQTKDSLKQTNDHLKQTNDSSRQTNDPSKQTDNDKSKPTVDDHLKLTRENLAKPPPIQYHFKLSTGEPLNLARSPSFDVTQRKVEARRTDRRPTQNDGKKAVLDLLKGQSRRQGSGRECVGVRATPGPERAQPPKPSRCDSYVFEALRRVGPSREANGEDVQKYIRDNDLMPADKEKWIKQWLRTVSPSVRDDDLEGDPAPPTTSLDR